MIKIRTLGIPELGLCFIDDFMITVATSLVLLFIASGPFGTTVAA